MISCMVYISMNTEQKKPRINNVFTTATGMSMHMMHSVADIQLIKQISD